MPATFVVNKTLEDHMETLSVRISKDLVEAARKSAAGEFRTIQGQLEFWARVGKASIENPDLPPAFVAGLIQSSAEPRDLAEPFTPSLKNKK